MMCLSVCMWYISIYRYIQVIIFALARNIKYVGGIEFVGLFLKLFARLQKSYEI